MWLALLSGTAPACQSDYYCDFGGIVSGIEREFLPGDAVPMDAENGCGYAGIALVDADGVQRPVAIVASPPTLLVILIPHDLPPGSWTILIPGYYDQFQIPIEVVDAADRDPATVFDFDAFNASVHDTDSYYPYGCGSGDGAIWRVDARLVLDGNQGANWLMWAEQVGASQNGTWAGIDAGSTTHVNRNLGRIDNLIPAEACVVGALYDPTFELVEEFGEACAPIEGAPAAATPEDTGDDDAQGCAAAPVYAPWLAVVACVVGRFRRAASSRDQWTWCSRSARAAGVRGEALAGRTTTRG